MKVYRRLLLFVFASRVLPLAVCFCSLAVAVSHGQENRAYRDPPQMIENPGDTVLHSAASRLKNSIASLAISSGGRLWATWYAGITHGENKDNYVVVASSMDGGKSWKDILAIDPDGEGPVRAFDPQAWVDPTGRLWIFWAQEIRRGGTTCGVWALTTSNPEAEHPEWSRPRRLSDGVMMGKPVVLSSGEWVLPVSFWHLRERGSAKILISTDQGRTWQERGAVDVPREIRSHDEHMIVERQDGSLWMLVRTRNGIGESVSRDRGGTWSPLTPSAIPSPSTRFFISRLNSGSLLLVKNGPIDVQTDRSLLTAYISRDDGRSWTGGLLLDGRQNVTYPDGQQAEDGTIYIIYDRRSHQQVLLAKFREDDVVDGSTDSGTVSLRMLVSRGEASPKAFEME